MKNYDFQEQCKKIALEEFREIYSRLTQHADSAMKAYLLSVVLEDIEKEFFKDISPSPNLINIILEATQIRQNLRHLLNLQSKKHTSIE